MVRAGEEAAAGCASAEGMGAKGKADGKALPDIVCKIESIFQCRSSATPGPNTSF